MAFKIKVYSDYKDLVSGIRDFTQKTFAAGAVTPGGGNTGEGSLLSASASENSSAVTWTIECDTGGGNEAAIFSVSDGSATVYPDATAGVPYSIDEVSFVVVAEGADFVATDSFTFSVASSTAQWVEDRWDTDYDSNGGYELIQHGIGGGSDEIYAGFRTLTDDLSYWNIENASFTGFVDSKSFEDQIKYMPEWTCGNNASFTAYISFDSRRIIYIIIAVAGSEEFGSAGWIDSYESPSQWSYPAYSGGSAPSGTATIGSTSGRGNFSTATNLSVLDGDDIRTVKITASTSYTWLQYVRVNPDDGSQKLFPATIIYESSDSVFGELPGIFWITPYVPAGGLATSGATAAGTVDLYNGTTKDITAVTFRNVTNTAAGQISAVELIGD